MNRRTGVRAIIVAMKRVTTVERRMVGRRTREARGAAKIIALVPERADRRKTKSPLRIESTSAEHSQNKSWSLDGLPHVSRGLMNGLPVKGAILEVVTLRLESRMREIRQSGSEGGAAQTNAPFLPLSLERRSLTQIRGVMRWAAAEAGTHTQPPR